MQHPCIVDYKGHVVFPPDLYLLLEYLPRGSLRQVIARGELPPTLRVRCLWVRFMLAGAIGEITLTD